MVRAACWASLEASPLSRWYLWAETDEHGLLEWSARIASGNWLDVPAWRQYVSWQVPHGGPEAWERRYQPNAFFTAPLYAYSLAAARRAGADPVTAARVFQLLLATVASAALAAACARCAGRLAAPFAATLSAGTAAGLLHGLYGPLLFHDGFAMRDGPVAHATALLVAAPILAAGGLAPVALLGVAGGLAILLKQTLLPVAVASVLLAAWREGGAKPGRRAAGAALVGLAGLALGVAPLVLRNARAGASLFAFDTRQAAGLAWGNAPGADGRTDFPPAAAPLLERARGETMRTARLVWDAWEGNRMGLARLLLVKARGAVDFYETPDNASFDFFRSRFGWLRPLPVWPCVFGPGLVGLAWAASRRALSRGEAVVAASALAGVAAACLLVQPVSRYRAGAIGPLALGTGLLVALLAVSIREGGRARLRAAGCAAAALALSLATLLPPPLPRVRHRFADTLVAATLRERFESPSAARAEVQRYLEEGWDDPARNRGILALSAWWKGDRGLVRLEPVASPP